MKPQKDKNKKIFDDLYNKHQHDIYNYCLLMVEDKDSADDAVQEVWMSLYKALEDGKVIEKNLNYLIRSAHNICCDRLYKDKKFFEFDDQNFENIYEKTSDPIEDMYSDEIIKQIIRLSKNMKDESFDCFVQTQIFDISYNEAAKLKGLKVDDVRQKVRRVLKYLRTKLIR